MGRVGLLSLFSVPSFVPGRMLPLHFGHGINEALYLHVTPAYAPACVIRCN